jgi:hypothetical protein
VDANGTVIDLTSITVVLPRNCRSASPALGCSRLIDGSNRIVMGMVSGNNLLTSITQQPLFPLDRFKETL